MCFFFLKTEPGAELALATENGVAVKLVDKAAGEEAVLSAEDVDPAVAIGDDNGTPPLAVAVDAMVVLLLLCS
jgi:hypothetical protein